MSDTITHIEKKATLAPELRFKEFDGEWTSCTLGSVTNYIKGFAFKSNDYQDEGIRIVRVSDLGANSIKQDNQKVFIDPIKAKEYLKYRIRKGNIIITTVGSNPEMIESAVGRGIYVHNDNEGLLNQNTLKLENISDAKNGFIIGYLNSNRYQHYMKGIARGNANQSNITVVDLFAYRIAVPSLPEQQKIASFLSAADEKIKQLTRKKELLEDYKKGVMQQIFSQQIRFKDENGNDFPEWEEKTLGQLATRVKQKNTDNAENFVLTNSATQGVVSQQDYFDKDIANQSNLEGYYVVGVNDFVYNPRISVHAPVGPIKRNKLQKGVMSPLYSVFRFKNDDLDYFELFFETTLWHRYLVSVANIGARHDRMNITNDDFYKMPVPFPCENERKMITNYLKSVSAKLESTTEQLTQTQTFKKGLLQKMFV